MTNINDLFGNNDQTEVEFLTNEDSGFQEALEALFNDPEFVDEAIAALAEEEVQEENPLATRYSTEDDLQSIGVEAVVGVAFAQETLADGKAMTPTDLFWTAVSYAENHVQDPEHRIFELLTLMEPTFGPRPGNH